MKDKEKALLEAYAEIYGPEAGPWNLSYQNLYIEYLTRKFFEDNFEIREGIKVCNVGIGVGDWDRYLSYLLANKGQLTSIDIDQEICDVFESRLKIEKNPYEIEVTCKDVNEVSDRNEMYDIVTIVGSTLKESDEYNKTLNSCVRILKNGGVLLHMNVSKRASEDAFRNYCANFSLKIENYEMQEMKNMQIHLWKIRKK